MFNFVAIYMNIVYHLFIFSNSEQNYSTFTCSSKLVDNTVYLSYTCKNTVASCTKDERNRKVICYDK